VPDHASSVVVVIVEVAAAAAAAAAAVVVCVPKRAHFSVAQKLAKNIMNYNTF